MLGQLAYRLHAVADFLLPRLCIVCGRRLNVRERHLCLHCLADFPLTRFWKMKANPMADRFNLLIQNALDALPQERYAFASALFFYASDSGYSQITRQLKYRSDIAAGRHFGRMLGQMMHRSGHFRNVDLVIPVPLHHSRKRERGYNQAKVIAGEVAACFGCTMSTDILKRRRRTTTQTQLSVEEKMRNVEGAFAAEIPDRDTSDGCGLPSHILLVDDVFTTGSTMFACFRALRSVFPPSVRISIATLGFVGEA